MKSERKEFRIVQQIIVHLDTINDNFCSMSNAATSSAARYLPRVSIDKAEIPSLRLVNLRCRAVGKEMTGVSRSIEIPFDFGRSLRVASFGGLGRWSVTDLRVQYSVYPKAIGSSCRSPEHRSSSCLDS